uniref:Uncharacterized protein n=1 Tax=Anguilla anguilla TaxID=7936 RepID=A0A0E9UU54_ANGAN
MLKVHLSFASWDKIGHECLQCVRYLYSYSYAYQSA